MEKEKEQVKFKRPIGAKGRVLGISIPPQLLEFLGVKDKDELTIIGDKNKRGQKYLALYKE